MQIVLVTGCAGLVGSESVRFFHEQGMRVIGIDNDMRSYFFGDDGSTVWNLSKLKEECSNFIHYSDDIRDASAMMRIFAEYGKDIALVIHNASQPSHDWAAREPLTDFGVNATGTLNMLEATRLHCPQAVFIFTSTNKVYGDNPNRLPFVEMETRWELGQSHPFFAKGIDENMSIDQCKHSVFGASKVAADIMTQEYGRYFGMKTGVFRGGCVTGPAHSGTELQGYLAYLMKCAVLRREYRIFGYKGKQVRDNIHSRDLVNCFYHFYQNPRCGEVYNIGGGRFSNCSILEAISLCEKITGNKVRTSYVAENRIGDHVWWVSDVSKFSGHYHGWQLTRNVEEILKEIFTSNKARWIAE
ncbi:MAG: NAD-dependent epimerase/dehydratase family protein [Candidatus Omnitrophica bacterium]|nr:NAD-dependent epimerase/dehydratase family protein [Candidatus Omnitrophota bacterium]